MVTHQVKHPPEAKDNVIIDLYRIYGCHECFNQIQPQDTAWNRQRSCSISFHSFLHEAPQNCTQPLQQECKYHANPTSRTAGEVVKRAPATHLRVALFKSGLVGVQHGSVRQRVLGYVSFILGGDKDVVTYAGWSLGLLPAKRYTPSVS